LRSDNPERASYPASADTTAIATLVEVLGPQEVRSESAGSGGSSARPRVSRALPDDYRERASAFAEAIVARFAGSGLQDFDGHRVRVVGRAARGGLRIDGGPEGFRERTVSLDDLGWVLAASDEAERLGVAVDEALVNRLRYVDGTRRDQTRWIDTGWAMRLWRASKSTESSTF
ncbi:MAG TPA: hypothetical protein PK095_09350, partial [Myxococcota bacterium]|nr:hypothetical protein [Myxococcota bacterium]